MRGALWKIRRELLRVGSQLLEPYRQIRDALLRVDYRLRHAHHVQHFEGQVELADRVAVFLLYQPQGVAQSVFMTCEHLQDQGYACVVVSNGELNPADLNRMLPKVAHVIVRPNFGYDFGGYQEALIWLRQRGGDVNQLLLMNDSVWFPALKGSSFLMEMEKADADVVGALSAQRGAAQRHQRKLFYASFMLLFSGKVWRSAKFENFWKHYRQTSSKPRTIRKGERKLSALFIHDDAYTHHAMVSAVTYEQLLADITSSTWPLFARELGLIDTSFAQQRKALLLRSGPDVEEAWHDWYRRLCESQNMFTCAQASLVLRAGVPLIKKSKDPHNMLVLRQSVEAFRLDPAFDPLVAQEIQVQVDRYFQNLRA
jgi:hypothetical protein